MNVFRDTFWGRVAPPFPNGCDPYNSLDEVRRRGAELVAEMEKAWKACFVSTTPKPDFIVIGAFTSSACQLYEHHVPGRVTYPYGREAA